MVEGCLVSRGQYFDDEVDASFEALCERTHMLVPWWARVVSLSAFGGCTSPTENLMGLESRSSLTPLLSARDHDGPHVFGAFVA